MPLRRRLLCGLAASALLLAGCSSPGSSSSGADASHPPSSSGAASSSPSDGAVTAEPLIQGLDVCSLASEAQVTRASGVPGEPTTRALTRLAGYDGLVDQCGYGVSFDSFTVLVSVGMAPATRRDLAGLPGRPVAGIGTAARVADQGRYTRVSFLKGSTLVQVQALKNSDGVSRSAQVLGVARQIADAVPSDPPETDAQTKGLCARVDPRAVTRVLGGPAGVSRTLLYKDRSAVCSWATGARNPRTVAVGVYTNRLAGPFFADQKTFEASRPIRRLSGDAFTIPGVAYDVADDGQVVSVSGSFPPAAAPGRPLPVTPALTALLGSAATLMQ